MNQIEESNVEGEFFLPGKTEDELKNIFAKMGEPAYRARQAFRRLNHHLADSIDEFTEFSKPLREKLVSLNAINPSGILKSSSSFDGTEKVLFDIMEDGKASQIETVWLPSGKRRTICVSTQSGCSYNCAFCATGTLPFKGNLTTAQILAQVYGLVRKRKELPSNIVFMGMGEPLQNYDAVMKASHILHDPNGLNISARHITISTVGVIPGIQRMIDEDQPFNLAVSLNHSYQEGRQKIMDVEKKFPMTHLLTTLKKYTSKTGKTVTFEYVMIPGVNMSNEDATRLTNIAKSMKAKVNLIPLNTKMNGMRPPSEDEILRFQDRLYKDGVRVFNRGYAGRDIDGACGMLALKG